MKFIVERLNIFGRRKLQTVEKDVHHSSTQPAAPDWKDLDESRRSLYAAYLEDFARMGSRQENIRTYYVSLLTALLGLLALAGNDGVFATVRWEFFAGLGVVGVIICLAWRAHMASFGVLFQVKRQVLIKLEEDGQFLLQPFSTETQLEVVRTRFSAIDQRVALAFLVLFILLAAYKLYALLAPGSDSGLGV